MPTTSRRGDSLKAAPRDTRLPRSNCWHAASQVLQGFSPSPAALHLGPPWMLSGGLLGKVLVNVASSHFAQIPSSATGLSEPRVSLGSSPACPAGPFPLTPTFHHLQHPHAAQRYQEGSSVQADAQGMPRQPPQSGTRPDPGFLIPTMLPLPTYLD